MIIRIEGLAQCPKRKAVMRTNFIALFFALTIITAYADVRAQGITLTVNKAPIKTVLEQIRKQSGYPVVYNNTHIKQANAVTMKVKNASLKETLDECFKSQPLTYDIVDNSIVVTIREASQIKKVTKALRLTGTVTDESGNPLPGVNVRVKCNGITSLTNEKGFFNIEAPQSAVLEFSYVGFMTQTTRAEDSMVITLIRSTSRLDEVQVIAYGTTTQRLATGSVTKITADEISKQTVGNSLGALIGRVPGLLVTQSNGVPGSPFKLQIRGQNAMGMGSAKFDVNSDPLIIIDGVPFAPNNDNISVLSPISRGLSPMNLINPSDIESIEFLKDADATSIYGSRGAFGVILITTKKGIAGKTALNATVSSGFSQADNKIKLLNTGQYLEMRNEAFKNDGITPDQNAYDLTVWDKNRYTDWQKEMIGGTADYTDAQLSLSGGSIQTQFIMNGGYHHETTVFPGDLGSNRGAVHVNVNHSTADKRFNANLSVNYAADKNKLITGDFMRYVFLPPNQPSFLDAAGKIAWEYNGIPFNGNPYADVMNEYTSKSNNLLSNLQLSYRFIDGLVLKSGFGYNSVRTDEVSIFPQIAQNPLVTPNVSGFSQFGANAYTSWIIEPQAEYKKSIAKGMLTVLTGGTFQSQQNNYSSISASGFSGDALLRSIGAASGLQGTGNPSAYSYQGVFARLNYNLNNEYILNLTGRRDGSSRFGPGKQFGSFGSVGAAWIFSGEDFIKEKFPLLSYGKLRSSYGTSGSDQIGDYQFLDSWRSTAYTYENNPGLTPARLFNADYGWEINRKFEAALDLGFMKDRILLSASYYRNRSGNHLLSYALPIQTGFTTITKNLPALVQNTGLELTLSSTNIKSTSFTWSTNFNLTIPRNKLVSFPGLAASSYYYTYQTGESLNLIEGLQYLGVDPQTGIFKFADKNGDQKVTLDDRIKIGTYDPEFYGGMGNQFNYKNWSLDFFIDFKKQLNNNLLSYAYNSSYIPGTIGNVPTQLLKRWQRPGMSAAFPQFTTTPTSEAYQSVATNNDGANSGNVSMITYFRLKSLSLSCNLKGAWISQLQIKTLRLFTQGQNLWTVSNYKDGDPENPNFRNLPALRSITAGIQVGL